jgi:metallo-beta-lactamase class B
VIAGNLYYVGTNEMTSYLIATPAGHIVIDGGFEETAPIILGNIRRLGFDPKDVRFLLASHAHYDHAGGLAALKRATGAKFVASRGDAPQFARGGLDDPQFGDAYPFPPIEADRIIDDGDTVSLGGTTLTARITPGHTRGCTTWTMAVRDGNQRLNVVFVGSPTAPAEYRLTGNPRYPDAVADYRRQFEILRSLRPDIFLASHGAFFDLETKRKTRRFMNPDEYRDFVEAMASAFERHVASETEAAKGH